MSSTVPVARVTSTTASKQASPGRFGAVRRVVMQDRKVKYKSRKGLK